MCGEIDCREGLPGAVVKKKYACMSEAVEATAAVYVSALETLASTYGCSMLQCVAVCCSVLQCVAVCCSVLQCVAMCCNVLQCAAVVMKKCACMEATAAV